jgi:hypothetical protein
MDNLKNMIITYREKFRRLDRKWHVLIGTQLLFVAGVIRFRAAKERNNRHLMIEAETDFGMAAPKGSSKEGKE